MLESYDSGSQCTKHPLMEIIQTEIAELEPDADLCDVEQVHE